MNKGERFHGALFVGGRFGTTATMDAEEKKEYCTPIRKRKLSFHPAGGLILYRIFVSELNGLITTQLHLAGGTR
jgi:hypothetical protein